MYMAIEALADGGVKMGIRRDLALKLAAQTLLVKEVFFNYLFTNFKCLKVSVIPICFCFSFKVKT